MCCRCNNRRRKNNGNCHDERVDIRSCPRRRGINGAKIDVYPNRRRGEFRRMAQIFQLGR
jgi:hypothetical protein